MDFIDFDTLTDHDQLPHPQPALSLPISSNIETLGKKFSNFNSLTRNLLKLEESSTTNTSTQEDKLAQKYANVSLDLLTSSESQPDPLENPQDDVETTKILSSRLARVLNTPLSDTSIREIFSTLEAKIEDTDNLVEPGVVGSMARKKFRGTIEEDLIRNQSLLLKEYQPVIKELKAVEARLDLLNQLLKSTTDRVLEYYDSTKAFNGKVDGMKRENVKIQLKKDLLASFRKQFTLNEYQEYVLKEGEINDEFFIILAQAESISEKCSILLSLDNPQLGLKIMNKVNSLVNRAVDRILTFTNKTLSNLYSLNTRSRLQTLHKCLRYTKNRLTNFNAVISTFVESRSKVIVDELLSQTGGNIEKKLERRDSASRMSVSSNGSRPLILSAHDPVRFIGDLLAYVHSVVVNEHELIASILTLEYTSAEEENEFNNLINNITSKTLKALSKPVKSKIDQTVSSETKLSTLFEVFNLLDLYKMMYSKQLKSEESSLVQTMSELIKLCQDKIFNMIRGRLATIRNSNLAQLDMNSDLQPPEWIIEFYFDLLPIVDQITTETVLNLPKEQHDEFLRLIVNEPINIFYEHVQKNIAKVFTKKDQLILKHNFLDLVLSKIMPLSLLGDKTLELSEYVSDLTQELTTFQLTSLFEECNLLDLYNVVNMICPFEDDFFEPSMYEPIVENKLFNKKKLQEVNETVQEVLPTALLDVHQSLLRVNSPSVVSSVVVGSSMEFIKFYAKFDALCQEFLHQTLLTWHPIEVATLLGVEKEYQEYERRTQ